MKIRRARVTDLKPGTVLASGAEVSTVEILPPSRFRRERAQVTFTDGRTGTVGTGVHVLTRETP